MIKWLNPLNLPTPATRRAGIVIIMSILIPSLVLMSIAIALVASVWEALKDLWASTLITRDGIGATLEEFRWAWREAGKKK